MNWEFALFLLPGLVIGLTVHEAAHAISAKWLGDHNAQRMGRVSLNPFVHLAPLGTLALFVLGFGWGKPVIVNLYNFRKPKFYYFLSSIAGPVSNLLLCGIALGILYLKPHAAIDFLCRSVFLINAILMLVNLIPIPPLDGSKIWPCLIPGLKPTYSGKWNTIWMAVVVILMMSNGVGYVIEPVMKLLLRLMPQ